MHLEIFRNYFVKPIFISVIKLIAFLILGYLLLFPAPSYSLGSLFFGKVPQLYNVTLAQFFFERAAHPLVGKPYPFAYHQLSRTYFIKGNLPDSLDLANKEMELYPNHLQTYYIIGLTLGYLNREEEAIEAFTKYIEFNPKTWAARNDKAWLQFRIGDLEGALQTIEPVAGDISNPWIQNTYGTLLMNFERYDEAEEAFIYAQNITNNMTEASWGKAYPGNDPRIYDTGLNAMRTSIKSNLTLLKEK